MGRKLVEATNACRIRRTRGDMARRRRRAAACALAFCVAVFDFVLKDFVEDDGRFGA